jgi:hypothetical protein
MGKMGLPIFTVNEDVIKEDKEKMIDKGLEDVIHENLKKFDGALHNLKGMTKNS